MPTHDLHTFMAQVTSDMSSEYDRIYARAAADPGTAGDEGEENWATVLREWLPPSYQVMTKGRLISHDGRMSPQIDIVVLKPSYPKKLLEKRIWIANGVVAAFECKNTVTAADVRASVQRCRQFKELFDKRTGSPRQELKSPLTYGLLAHSHSWKGENSKPIENIEKALKEESEKIDEPRFGMDLMCVADLAAWASNYMAKYESSYNEPAKNDLERIFGGSWGPMTSFVCSSYETENQKDYFRPIGAFIAKAVQSLAWDDPLIRDIADYYRMADLWGSGAGAMKFWPQAVLSDRVRTKMTANQFATETWGDWRLVGV